MRLENPSDELTHGRLNALRANSAQLWGLTPGDSVPGLMPVRPAPDVVPERIGISSEDEEPSNQQPRPRAWE